MEPHDKQQRFINIVTLFFGQSDHLPSIKTKICSFVYNKFDTFDSAINKTNYFSESFLTS